MKNFKNLLLVALFFATAAVFGQTKITGKVVDGSNEPLPSASVVVKGTTNGTSTNFDGNFTITASSNSGVIIVSFVGYETKEVSFSSSNSNLGTIQLVEDANTLDEVVVVGTGIIDLANTRRTPVAVSTVRAAEIQKKIGAQDVTATLVNTPSVYVAGQAGGFGDSRISVRGFAQDNTSYLLNGQPINGMEDGKMYWSNWSGINDIASAIQIQRGLGASKLAISSVGGTTNFVIKTTDKDESGYFYAGMANDAYYKTTLSYNSGRNENGFGVSAILSYWQGDGYNDGTKGAGQTYFLSFGYTPNEVHNFNFLITGAPQFHDQNFSKRISDYLTHGKRYNNNWGTYKGEYMTERRNFYHKPVINFNWDYKISEDAKLSTVLYGSFGRGGGTGNRGNRIRTGTGNIDYDAIYAYNNGVANGAGGYFTAGGGYVTRASMNLHSWFGVVSSYEKKINDNLTFNIGADLRTYYGEHFRVVENFHGLTSWKENIRLKDATTHQNLGSFGTYKSVTATKSYNASAWGVTFMDAPEDQKIAYSNDERISYAGIFTQLEYANDNMSAFFQGSLSKQQHQRFDHYQYADETLINGTSSQATNPLPAGTKAGVNSEKVSNVGYNIKTGISFNLDDRNKIFFNLGMYSRQPYHDNIYLNFSNQVNPLTNNEKIFGMEAGYKFGSPKFYANVNLYNTVWKDRVVTSSRVVGGNMQFTANQGVMQVHSGLEVDFRYKITEDLNLKGFTSLGSWEYRGTAISRITDEDQNILGVTTTDIDGGKVGDAAQTTFGLGVDYKISDNFSIDADYRYYADLYANVGAVKNNLELPSYAITDFGASYKFKLKNSKTLNLRLNINNLLNTEYLSDLRTNITADSNPANNFKGINVANQGYFGYGTTWNIGARYRF